MAALRSLKTDFLQGYRGPAHIDSFDTLQAKLKIGRLRTPKSTIEYLNFLIKCNKALVPKLLKFAKIGVGDGVSNFAPKIITMKMDC